MYFEGTIFTAVLSLRTEGPVLVAHDFNPKTQEAEANMKNSSPQITATVRYREG